MDKLRKTASLAITLADGESPTAAKLNALSNSLRTSTSVLEKAIGDLWNQSGDSMMVSYPLQIPNLARTVGESKFLNPCLYPVDEDFIYVDNLGAKYENENEFYLQFKPKNFTSLAINDSGGSALVTRKDNKYEVDSAGEYWIDANTGKVITFTAISSTAEVQYTVDSSTWNNKDYTLPSVIPDPRQADFTSCRISQSGSTFYLHLPPRVPLTIDFDNGSLDGFSLPERYPPSGDFSDNYDSTVGATDSKKLWQNPASSALADAFYRYSLPKEIKDQLTSINVGDTLPVGFLYLWDKSSGTIVADASFKKTADDWIFQVQSSSIDFSSKVSTTETESSYNNTNYSVIAVGSPISRNIWTLFNSLYNHTHGNEGDFSSLMEHSKLTGLNPPAYNHADHTGRYPSDVPAWAPSRWAGDDHVSLLSRAGSQGVGSTHRDVNDNAMLGDLILASTTAVGDNYLNITASSNKLYFGSVDGPYMFYDEPSQGVTLQAVASGGYGLIVEGTTSFAGVFAFNLSSGPGVYGSSASGAGVKGQSTSDYGVEGISSLSYGVVAQGDPTSPIKSSLRIVPQNAAPTSPSEGDIYPNSVDHHLYYYNGSGWVQLDN